MRIMSKSIAALALSLSLGSAQAALVNFTLTGETIYADAGNLFGLSNGSLITVAGTFDDSVLIGGLGTVYFDPDNSGNTFTITAGNFSYTNADDDSYAFGGYPTLDFSGGPLPTLDFWHTGSTDFISQIGQFDGYDGITSPGTVSGVWTQFEMTPVPVPAAVWLFGSGLLGLVGIARRKSAA